MPTQNPIFQKLQNNRFKNVTLEAKGKNLGSQLTDKINKSMDEFNNSVDYIINDPDKSDHKKIKDLRVTISGQNDLVSMFISDALSSTKETIDHLMKRTAPESSPEDVIVLQHMLKNGITPSGIHKNPELANIVVNTKYSSYLFQNDDIIETSQEVAFKYNLGDDYQKYIDAKENVELAEEYADAVGQYLNEIEAQVTTE